MLFVGYNKSTYTGEKKTPSFFGSKVASEQQQQKVARGQRSQTGLSLILYKSYNLLDIQL